MPENHADAGLRETLIFSTRWALIQAGLGIFPVGGR
jgi:hypothetical protein